MKHRILAWICLIGLCAIVLAGCNPAGTTLSADDQAAVLAFTEPKTDGLLAGMNAGDYAMFSADFDQDMLNAMTQTQFEALKKDRDARLGSYVSREVNSVIESGDFYSVIYDTKFEKDDAVTMRVVFRAAEPHEISGLWFNK